MNEEKLKVYEGKKLIRVDADKGGNFITLYFENGAVEIFIDGDGIYLEVAVL